MIERLQTARLIATRIGEGDFAELCELHRDPRVMATLGGVRTDESTAGLMRGSMAQWERHGYGLWIFRHREDGWFVGRGGLRNTEVEGIPEVEVAYALRADVWGQGLATEIALASLNVAFGPLALAAVIAYTLVTNQGSRRVMEKIGMQYEREFAAAGQPSVLYRLTAAQWARRPDP